MTKHADQYDVLINGGGPVGMGLAIELGQRGIKTCVVERHLEPQPIPKGQNLTQRSGEHFQAWHCEERLRTAHPIPEGAGIGGITTYGTLLSDYHYDWFNRAHVGKYYFAKNARLPQYATEQVLRARAAEIDCIDVILGWTGVAASQDDCGVTLKIRSTDDTQSDELTGRFLVGCDGSQSMVRSCAGISENRSEHNRLMSLLVFRSTELDRLLSKYPGKAFYNVLDPKLEGYWKFFGRVDHGHSWFFHAPVPLGTTKDNFDFKAMLHSAVGQSFDLELDHIGLWDLRIATADTYQNGRFFIAGDAAHSHPPYGGYGINTGFEDARNLGWKLAATLQGTAGPHLLNSYTEERRQVFQSTAKDFIENYIEEDKNFLRDYSPQKDRALFQAAWNARNLEGGEIDMYEPNYAGSSIVSGKGNPSAKGKHLVQARAGHHFSPSGSRTSIANPNLLGKFTLLAEDTDLVSRFRDTANDNGMDLTTGSLSTIDVDAYKSSAILIRPDGFVAWCGRTTNDCDGVLKEALGFR